MNMISKILIFVLSVSFFFSVASSSETKIMARELSWYETNYPNTTIDKIFEKIEGNYITVPLTLNENVNEFYIIDKTGIIFHEKSNNQLIVSSVSELPLDEINLKITPLFLVKSENSDFKYILNLNNSNSKSDIVDLFASYEQVYNITESTDIRSNSGCFIYNVTIKSDLTEEEVIQRYSNLELKITKIDINKDKGPMYTYTAQFQKSISISINDTLYYEELKRLVSDSNVSLNLCHYENGNMVDGDSFSSVLYEAYISDDTNGDIDSNGKMDITDLSMLSLYLIGDLSLSEHQILLSDIDCNGIVNLADLALFRQKLSKAYSKL